MSLKSCEACAWEQPDPTGTKLAGHMQLRHPDLTSPPLTDPVEPLAQLPRVAFQQAFLEAVRSLPIGKELTTAELHALVPEPERHQWWGQVTKAAADLGWLGHVTTQKSELPTTNSSLVNRWVRTEPTRRAS